jgi:hypothetical protein
MKEMERLAALETNVDNMYKILTRLEAKIDAYQSNFVPRKELEKDLDSLSDRVADLEGTNRWLWRTVGAVLITGLMSLVVLVK